MKSLLFVLSFLLSTSLSAEQCKLLRVGADTAWPPYSRTSGAGFAGVGPHILNVSFGELEIPVSFVPINLAIEKEKRFKFQNVDVIAATYRRRDWLDDLQFIEPAYAADRLGIALRKETNATGITWSDLTGAVGGKAASFVQSASFEPFAKQYLFIRQESSADDLLTFLRDSKYEYAVGSRYQIRYVSHETGLDSLLLLLSDPNEQDDVYLAFVKNSPCLPYAAYLKKRLRDWKEDGTLARWLEEMMPKDATPPEEVGLEALG